MSIFIIKNFRQLIVYNKPLNLLKNFKKEDLSEKEFLQVRFAIAKICGYIAKSQGSALYPEDSKNHFNKALKWTTILDKQIRELKLNEEEKRKYKNEVNQIRRILISLKKKLEEDKDGKSN